ncbi:MAG: transcription antitermination factor NusB [Clostridiaceae bacterium]|nr:transcription antitermination factor NusB [Clostridiaceae bacterium]
MGRRLSRENAMKLLYQFQLRNDDIEEQIELFLSENENLDDLEKDYFFDIVRGATGKLKEIDKLIESHAKGWSLERMPKVDLAIMRLAIYELIYRDDIPFTVSINEAVELAKKYGADQSKAFINGILGKIVAELRLIKEQ